MEDDVTRVAFFVGAGAVGLTVLIMYVLAYFQARKADQPPAAPLGIASGSVRSLLAVLIIGSYIVFLMFGAPVLGDPFESILAAYGTLAGAAAGFYFGQRGSARGDDANPTGNS